MAKKPIKIKVEEDRDRELVPKDEKDNPIPKSSCALWFIFLLLFVILLALIGLLFYLKTKDLSFSKSKTNTNTNTSIQLDSSQGEDVTLKITEAQLQSAIKADDANFPIKKVTVKITTDKINISGKTSNNFWGLNVEVSLVPKVENGKVKFDITEIKSAGMKAPNSISDVVNNNLGQYLDGLSSSIGDVEVSAVELSSGYLTVTGRQK